MTRTFVLLGRAFLRAFRTLRRSPAFAATVTLFLALGVGANTAIFAVVDAVLLRELPFPKSAELLTVGLSTTTGLNWRFAPSYYRTWAAQSRMLESIASFAPTSATVVANAPPEYVQGAMVSSSLLHVLQTQPAFGRWFTPADEAADAPSVVVLSHELWQRQFSGDSRVLGRIVSINGNPSTVVGVMPPGFNFPGQATFWQPGLGFEQVVARARPAIWPSAVQYELGRLAPGAERAGRPSERIVVVSLHDQLYGSTAPVLRLLFGAVMLLLLIACGNIANLSIVRALARRNEFGVRAALGASRWDLSLEVIAENLLLAIAGGALGVLVAAWIARTLARLSPASVTHHVTITVDPAMIVFGGVTALAMAVLISVTAAVMATRGDLQPRLRQHTGAAGTGRLEARVRGALVVGQLSLALLLVAGAGLLVRSVVRLTRADLGFEPQGVLVTTLNLVPVLVPGDRAAASAVLSEVVGRVRALPGVRGVAVGPAPLVGAFTTVYTRPSGPDTTSAAMPIMVKVVDPSYFDVWHVRMLLGRGILPSDDSLSPTVVVLNFTAARLFFPGGRAVGHRLDEVSGMGGLFGRGPAPTVAGIVSDIRQSGVGAAVVPELFIPAAQRSASQFIVTISIRTEGDPVGLINPLRRILQGIHSGIAPTSIATMDELVNVSLAPHRFLLTLLGVFAALALTLAALGLYAVVSYLVAHRSREIGVRLALGAQRADVLGLVLREAATLTLLGIAVGMPAAFMLTRLLTNFLYDVTPRDAVVFVSAPLLLAAVSLVAAYVPARRAATVDPMVALRHG